jgi:hypothetical protein
VGHQRASEHAEARAMPRDLAAEQRRQYAGGEDRRGRQHQRELEGEQRKGLGVMAVTRRRC